MDPAYHNNIGDTLISYGELVLMEKMGFINHTECGYGQSKGRNKNCGDFSYLEDGGLAVVQGKLFSAAKAALGTTVFTNY